MRNAFRRARTRKAASPASNPKKEQIIRNLINGNLFTTELYTARDMAEEGIEKLLCSFGGNFKFLGTRQ